MSGGSRLLWILLSISLCVFVSGTVWAGDDSSASAKASLPKTKVDGAEDIVQGHKIPDPYRWLEKGDDPATQQFVRDELAYTRSILDPLPGRQNIHQRLQQLLSIGTIGTPQLGGPYFFYTRREGSQNQPILYVREGVHGSDRALVDVNRIAADGTVALDWWYPSEHGKFVAYGTSPSGSEESTLHIIDTASGQLLPDTIERTRLASVSWKKDDSGFFYVRNPRKGDVPPGEEVYHWKVFYHRLGADPAKDALIFGDGLNLQFIPFGSLADDDDRWLILTVSEGPGKTELYLQDLQSGAPPVAVATGKDARYYGEVFQGRLYLFTNEDAPNYRVLVTDVAHPQRDKWKVLIPESDAVLQGVSVVGGKLLAQYEKNATSQLQLFDLQGTPRGEITLPALGNVTGLGGKWDRTEVFFGFQSFTIPPSVYQIDPSSRHTTMWDKIQAPGIDAAAYQVSQVWFRSKDGTKVPMFLVHKKGLQLNGMNPTLLTGYGGFNVSLTPTFSGARFLWLENGGVFAVANLRGGSEFGEQWHRAGMLRNKQNVFDDFIAAAEFLISDKVTDKNHLAIQGGSNGGLLVGAVLTQRPDLFRAVVCQVPLLDMLRYQNFQIAKLWIPEYGSADDPQQFEWLYAYSPYHHVIAGTEYPAVLFMTAESDTRVDPMHARKMAALMQAKAANGESRERPILLRIETKAGHGQGKPITKLIEEGTDVYSFLYWQLGVKQ